jgi:hypothetical protein
MLISVNTEQNRLQTKNMDYYLKRDDPSSQLDGCMHVLLEFFLVPGAPV